MIMTMIKGKVRLWIEYALIGLIVVMSGFVVTLWLEKQTMLVSIANMGAELTIINLVNSTQENTIKDLLIYREQDAAAIQGLLEQETLSDRAINFVNTKLTDLERENEDVRNFLNIDIPSRLCILARDCAPHRSEDNSSKNDTANTVDKTMQ
jgi:hypothetical protein